MQDVRYKRGQLAGRINRSKRFATRGSWVRIPSAPVVARHEQAVTNQTQAVSDASITLTNPRFSGPGSPSVPQGGEGSEGYPCRLAFPVAGVGLALAIARAAIFIPLA